MNDDLQAAPQIRALFAWSHVPGRQAAAHDRPAVAVSDDDLELALKLVGCAPLDVAQQRMNRGA